MLLGPLFVNVRLNATGSPAETVPGCATAVPTAPAGLAPNAGDESAVAASAKTTQRTPVARALRIRIVCLRRLIHQLTLGATRVRRSRWVPKCNRSQAGSTRWVLDFARIERGCRCSAATPDAWLRVAFGPGRRRSRLGQPA